MLTNGFTQHALTEGERLAMEMEERRYQNWPYWAVELDRKMNEIIRMLDEREKSR